MLLIFMNLLLKTKKILTDRLRKNPPAWNEHHTMTIRKIEKKVRRLSYLNIANQDAPKIIETDASDMGYGGILKQKIDDKKNLIRFTSST